MKNLPVLLFVCLLSLSLSAADRLVYESRADRSPETDWRLTKGDVKMTQAPWPDGVPGLAVRLDYAASPDGWPSGKYWLPEGERDWRGGKLLRAEFYCTEPGYYGICVATYNDPKYYNNGSAYFEAGRHVVTVDFVKLTGYDLSDVKYIDFYASRPKTARTAYIGNIVLEMADPVAEAAQRRAIFAEWKSSLERRVKESSRLGIALSAEVRSLRDWSAGLPADPGMQSLEEFRKRCKALFPKMDCAVFRKSALPENDFGALWCTPEEKVLRHDYAFRNAPSTECMLSAARGEGESAQLALYAMKALKSVKVECSKAPVHSDGETVLPSEAVSVSPVGFLKSSAPTYPVEHIGFWPDPILEYLQTPISVEEGCYQCWWLDIRVPEDQKPGEYHGELRVTADGVTQLVPFVLCVRNFALPKGSAYPTLVEFTTLPKYPADPGANREYWKAIAKMLLDHRMDPYAIYHHPERKTLVEDSKWLLEQGARCFNLGYIIRPVDDAIEKTYADAYRMCVEAGIADKATIYCYDESGPLMFENIRKSLPRLRKAAPGVPIYTTLFDRTYGPASGLDGLVDLWIPGTPIYEATPQEREAARARGAKVGWYVCCGPLPPYANLMIENPAVGSRLLMGFMNRKYRPDGFLYYLATFWRHNYYDAESKMWIDKFLEAPIQGGPLIENDGWHAESYKDMYSGDGRLLYPGADGPVPTTRLKNIRDGEDDWLYMDLLEKALADESAPMSSAWRQSALRELEVEPSIVASLSVWTQDAALVQQKRERLAALLEEYYGTAGKR